MTLSTEVFTHVISTFSGSKIFITADQEKVLHGLSGNEFVHFGEETLNAKNIAEVLTVEDYNKQHPKPVSMPDYVKFEPVKPIIRTSEDNRRTHQSMINGLCEYIDSDQYKGTYAPIGILMSSIKRFKNKYKEYPKVSVSRELLSKPEQNFNKQVGNLV